jgi:hypothetical protein
MVLGYLAQYISEKYKTFVNGENPNPVFKKPDAYKNINSHVFITNKK